MTFCDWAIADLPGLNKQQRLLLQKNGITTTQQLLAITQTPQAKQKLASVLHLHPRYILKWVAMADLAQIPSVGIRYCGLLLHGGIASRQQLAETNFARLHQNIIKLQVAQLQRRDLAPSLGQVKQWVTEAKDLHRAGRQNCALSPQ